MALFWWCSSDGGDIGKARGDTLEKGCRQSERSARRKGCRHLPAGTSRPRRNAVFASSIGMTERICPVSVGRVPSGPRNNSFASSSASSEWLCRGDPLLPYLPLDVRLCKKPLGRGSSNASNLRGWPAQCARSGAITGRSNATVQECVLLAPEATCPGEIERLDSTQSG